MLMQHNGKVPLLHDLAVTNFLKKWNLTEAPLRLDFTDYGYEAAWCHVSAKHRAMSYGGRRVHGWALWKFESDLVADHHSVWETEKGNLVDVTPPSNGGAEILFVRDDTARIEQDAENILFFTQRTADGEVHWLWQGKPSDYPNWNCPTDKPDLVEYLAKLELPISVISTDLLHG
jgi:hypothetical protein